MTSSGERLFWQQRELERILGLIRPELTGTSGHLHHHVNELERLRDSYALPTVQLEALRAVEATLAAKPEIQSLHNLISLELPVVRAMREQQDQIDALLDRLGPAAAATVVTRGVVESLASTEALLRTDRLPPPLIEVSLQPQLDFQPFALSQLEFAAAATGVLRDNHLRIVGVASGLLESMQSRLDLAAEWWPLLDTPRIDAPDFNIFRTLGAQVEELDLEDESLDVEAAVQGGSAAVVADLGGQIVILVYKLNVKAERDGHPLVFKPTNKGLLATCVVGSHVASDEESFGNVVDCLFFLLYEGSGSANRLTERVDASRLDALWTLKNIRLGHRHDVDHGKSVDVRKKNEQIGAAFRGLIGKPVPKTASEWAHAQAQLYSRLVDMLEDIWLSS